MVRGYVIDNMCILPHDVSFCGKESTVIGECVCKKLFMSSLCSSTMCRVWLSSHGYKDLLEAGILTLKLSLMIFFFFFSYSPTPMYPPTYLEPGIG